MNLSRSEFLSLVGATEAFYRFTVTDNLALTPDVQLVRHPALNPGEDVLWALGFRARVTF